MPADSTGSPGAGGRLAESRSFWERNCCQWVFHQSCQRSASCWRSAWAWARSPGWLFLAPGDAGFGDGGVGDFFEGGDDFAVGARDSDLGVSTWACARETMIVDELPKGGIVDGCSEVGDEDGGFGEGVDEGGDGAGVVDGAEGEGEGPEFAVGTGAIEFGAEFGDGGFADGDEVADGGVGFFGGGGGDDGIAELVEEGTGVLCLRIGWSGGGRVCRSVRRDHVGLHGRL